MSMLVECGHFNFYPQFTEMPPQLDECGHSGSILNIRAQGQNACMDESGRNFKSLCWMPESGHLLHRQACMHAVY